MRARKRDSREGLEEKEFGSFKMEMEIEARWWRAGDGVYSTIWVGDIVE
jgi:hypothetical protein